MSADIGMLFVYVPFKILALVRKVSPYFAYWKNAFSKSDPVGVYVYCRGGARTDSGYHARMFDPDFGISEDAATWAAAVGFSRVIEAFEIDAQTKYETIIEQGFEMKRPSLLKLEVEFQSKGIKLVRLGGKAVLVASGELM